MSLPGHELIERGLFDLERGIESAEALLIAVGAPRLRWLGVAVPPTDRLPSTPEHRLYDRLCADEPEGARDAHSRYNALIRRLVSFERALESERERGRRRPPD